MLNDCKVIKSQIKNEAEKNKEHCDMESSKRASSKPISILVQDILALIALKQELFF